MKCYSCGTEIRDGARFCHYCGEDQKNAPTAAHSAVPRATPATPKATATAPQATPTVPQATPTVPQATPTAPQATPTAPQATPTVPQATPTAPQNAPAAPAAPAPAPVSPQAPQPQQPVCVRPVYQLPEHRSLGKMFWLGLLTSGIYPMVIYCRIVEELNMVASAHDGKRTMQFPFVGILTGLTCGIYFYVWLHQMCERMGQELQRRGIAYKFGASTFWLWDILGSLILVGPFVFTHKMMKAMNKINADYNING